MSDNQPLQITWAYTSHHPRRLAYGVLNESGDRFLRIFGTVTRQKSGQWAARVLDARYFNFSIEPNRKYAQQWIEKRCKQVDMKMFLYAAEAMIEFCKASGQMDETIKAFEIAFEEVQRDAANFASLLSNSDPEALKRIARAVDKLDEETKKRIGLLE